MDAYPGSEVAANHIAMIDGKHTRIARRVNGQWVLSFEGEQLALKMFGK